MKFSIKRSAFQKGINRVFGVVPTKTPTPILGNLLFKLTDDKLHLLATDLEILIQTILTVEGIEEGAVALPAKYINDIVREFDDVKIEVSSEEGYRVRLLSDRGVYRIPGVSPDDFPTILFEETEKEITISSDIIQRMIEKVLFAVSTDELQPTLQGVLFQIRDEEFRVVSTDGRKLVKIVNKNFFSKGVEKDLIISTKALNLLLKNLEDDIENVRISLGENFVVFNLDHTRIYSRIIQGEYPDYEKVIPIDNDKRFLVNKEILTSCIRRVAIFSSSVTHLVRFSMKKDQIEIASEDVELGGEAREVIPAEYDGEAMEIGYNANYVLDILRHIDTEDVFFDFKTPTKASIITPTSQKEQEELMMLLMPIKLSEETEEIP